MIDHDLLAEAAASSGPGPGKFEGEPIETAYYYLAMLEWGEEIIEVSPEEGETFNLQPGSYLLKAETREQAEEALASLFPEEVA